MLSDNLKVLLASTQAFAIKSQNFHWNVEGSNFPQYHAFFDTLYGDVSALKLVDLAANGLSEYASLVNGHADNASSAVEAAFRAVDRDGSGSISLAEAQSMLLRLNSNLGRTYGERELTVFFQALDTNRDGQLSLDELRRAFLVSAL